MIRPALSTLLLVAFLGSASGGCGSSSYVVLRHPQTNQRVQCKVDPRGDDVSFNRQIETCLKAHEKAVVGDSDK
jgi:hypothetical protein